MREKLRFTLSSLMWAALLLAAYAVSVQAQTTAFTYQGKLVDNGNLANASYDIQFKLFDTVTVATGVQQGSTVTLAAVQVANGIFTVQLDFGAAAFPGTDRFLEIAVKPAGGPSYTTLAPRQQVSSTPYAIRSLNSVTADGLSAACANCVTGSQIQNVQGSQITGTISVASIPPGSGNYIQNGTNQQPASNFNISATGAADTFNAATQYQIAGSRVLSIAGTNNTFAGVATGAALTTGNGDSFFGKNAGQANTSGSGNAFFGNDAGKANSSGDFNSFFGASAGLVNSTGTRNSFFGTSAGSANTGNDNSFFGFFAGQLNSTGTRNSAFGGHAGSSNSIGNDNSFFGDNAGANNGAYSNSFFGSGAGGSNTGGFQNSFFGKGAGQANLAGNNNAFFGHNAGFNSNANDNSFFGVGAGSQITTGTGNAFVGKSAGPANQQGNNNSFFGKSTGGNSTGSNNTLIGASADAFGAITNATAIGANARVTQSNSLVLGSINGINGGTADTNVGIGTTAPANRLHVVGSASITGSLGVGTTAPATNLHVVGNTGITGNLGIGTTSPAEALDVSVNSGHVLLGNAGCNAGFTGLGFGSSLAGCANYSMLGNGTDTIVNRPTGGSIAFREANATQMSIAPGGAVTIGGDTAINGTLTLRNFDLGGSSQVCVKAVFPSTYIFSTCSSSLRYKTNLKPYQAGLDLINRLRPITFDWKADGMHDLGFGAEEVAAVEPLLVTHNAQGQIEGVKYDRISAALVNAVKEQQKQIDQLNSIKAENAELKAQLAAILARLERAEKKWAKGK